MPKPASPGPSAPETTRDLFRFERDDHTPDQLTTARITVSHRARRPIQTYLFGNFIEHLGGVIYEGLWAQLLLNPNLESIEPTETAPAHWRLSSGALWADEGYLSPLSVRLEQNGALRQTVFPPAYRVRSYRITFHLKALLGKAELQAALWKGSKALAAHTVAAEGDGWRQVALTLELPAALPKGEAADFALTHVGGGPVLVDQITLFPADNVQGMDTDVLKAAKRWQMPLVRYPGGNFVSGYRWQDGVGPRDRRPTRRNAAWGGVEPNHFGTDEFLTFCRLLGTEPQITVNAGNGTPEDAAAWVRYCNAPADDPMGRLRAANGHLQPYQVKLWEVGNELYGPWQIGHTDAPGNADRYVRFSKAMRQADPKIALIATGKGDEFTPEGWQRCTEWNAALLEQAVNEGAPIPDYLSLHPLLPLPGYLPHLSYAEEYESALAHPTYLSDTLFPALAALIVRILGPEAKTRIAPTEWGIIIGGDSWQKGPNHNALSGALYGALTLNAMLRNSDWVTLANMTAFMHGGGIKKPRGVVTEDPLYWSQELYTAAHPYTPVETDTRGPGRDVPARGALPAIPNVPDVDLFSALTPDGKSLVVFAVNRSLTEARPLRLDLTDFAPKTVSGTILTASDPQAQNTLEHPDTVVPRSFPTPHWKPEGWQIALPPHSLVLLTLR